MLNILYTIIIFPIIQLIELCYLFVYRIFDNHGISLLGVSLTVSICTLPLYLIAEKHQHAESEIQKRMKPKIDKIKKVFKGDERFMVLSTYYRQNHYHPVYSMRNVFGLLIQIPFFIAAYSYISHLAYIQNVSFLFIKDLGKPDNIITVSGIAINIMPIIMTIINCISGTVYAKRSAKNERIQLYAMSLIFLFLLYNSPAGLVLYWTMNNIFSLLKHCLSHKKNIKLLIYRFICLCIVPLIIYILFFHTGLLHKRIFSALLCSVFYFIPSILKILEYIKKNIESVQIKNTSSVYNDITFILTCTILFLLAGLVIPSLLIISSVQEFCFLESYNSPLPFLLTTMTQSAGIFLFWPICIYYLSNKKSKIILTSLLLIACIIAVINTFIFPGNYGAMNNMVIFFMTFEISLISSIINAAVILFVSLIILLLLIYNNKKIIYSIQAVFLISLIGFGIINIFRIYSDYMDFSNHRTIVPINNEVVPVYQFSQEGKNVLLIMLDRAISGYLPYIFQEKPELKKSFSGFTWYPNCVSFGSITLFGSPPVFGGYEYTPLEMQKRNTESLVEKHNQAILLLPKIFSEKNFKVTVTDPSFANYSWTPDLSIFDKYPDIHAENIIGKYSDYWKSKNENKETISVAAVLKKNLIRFSFFKISPLFFRIFIYDHGKWLANSETIYMSNSLIDNYSALDILPELTSINDSKNYFNMMINDTTHYPSFLQLPDYKPSTFISTLGTGPFAEEDDYHVNASSVIALGKWFDFLQENKIYNNTRIIIVSDHGYGIFSKFPNNITLPNGDCVQLYNPLLLVKDFDSTGEDITIDNSFMTNADSGLLAINGIIDSPVNPFTLVPLKSNKADGAFISTSGLFNIGNHGKYKFNIKKDEWLYVHDNIFDSKNWAAVQIQP
ncbi:inner membrane protein [Treponema primitia ZAS-2]|uniref:Inner membrane protein n=1 Tax=Treponema primitia (strain ATCC BAA-887 / DSM 12427 / ZAS-2) TaxID=545694 RepID=F5YHH5_TREPZ|nr:membrane protein insertase YidC [Treponema primitia]AEF83629.1 inner membrane protein [Treponema primitia ZAS-2]